MNIFIVTYGLYEPEIRGAFTDKEKAEAFIVESTKKYADELYEYDETIDNDAYHRSYQAELDSYLIKETVLQWKERDKVIMKLYRMVDTLFFIKQTL